MKAYLRIVSSGFWTLSFVLTRGHVPDFDGSVLRSGEDELVALGERSREDALEAETLKKNQNSSLKVEEEPVFTSCATYEGDLGTVWSGSRPPKSEPSKVLAGGITGSEHHQFSLDRFLQADQMLAGQRLI